MPSQVFTEKGDVLRVVVHTLDGSMGILPRRLDCVAALTPGILTYETDQDGEVFVAVDQGVLIKAGPEVLVSVRSAIGGTDLNALHAAVRREFQTLNEQEENVRSVMTRLESGFVRRLMEFQHG